MTLYARILIAVVVGGAVGALARFVPAVSSVVTALEPVGTIFIRLITMVVVPIVVASLFAGVASLGDVRRLGRIGGRTLAYFVFTTVAAAVIGVVVALVSGVGTGLDPAVRDSIAGRFSAAGAAASTNVESVPTLLQTIVAMVPTNPIAAAAQGDLLALIFFVVVFGAAATAIEAGKSRPLVAFFTAVNDVSMVVIGWLMRAAPIAVSVLVAVTVLRSGMDLLWSLSAYSLVVIAGLVSHVVLVLIPLLRFVARVGLGTFLRSTTDALVLAFSTASSSVTLPVSIRAAEQRLGISNQVASFVLPTGTTLNKNGAAVYKAVTAVFLAHLYGLDLDAGRLLTIILTTIVASSAGAGVPGSSLVTTMIVLNAIGLGANASAGIALVAGIDRPLDMCRTCVNTFSNLVGAAVIARGEGGPLHPDRP